MYHPYMRTLITQAIQTCSRTRDLRALYKDLKNVMSFAKQELNSVVQEYLMAVSVADKGLLGNDDEAVLCLPELLRHTDKARWMGGNVKSKLRMLQCITGKHQLDHFHARKMTFATNDLVVKCANKKENLSAVVDSLRMELNPYLDMMEQVDDILMTGHDVLLAKNSVPRLYVSVVDEYNKSESKTCAKIIESCKSMCVASTVNDDVFLKKFNLVVKEALFETWHAASYKLNNISQQLNEELDRYRPTLSASYGVTGDMPDIEIDGYCEALKMANEYDKDLMTFPEQMQVLQEHGYDKNMPLCLSLIFKLEVLSKCVDELDVQLYPKEVC